jgi:hypothetical protein
MVRVGYKLDAPDVIWDSRRVLEVIVTLRLLLCTLVEKGLVDGHWRLRGMCRSVR